MLQKFGCLIIALGIALPVSAADRVATISGVVRSANGVPQMGAVVDVLGSAIQTLRVFTDENGSFVARGITPGVYTLKVSAPSFLPTLREKIAVKAGATVLLNLTLSTIFDAIQFAPRNGSSADGDWDWVLRSTAKLRLFISPEVCHFSNALSPFFSTVNDTAGSMVIKLLRFSFETG